MDLTPYEGTKLTSHDLVNLGKNIAGEKKPSSPVTQGGTNTLKAKISDVAGSIKNSIVKLTRGGETRHYKKIAMEYISKKNNEFIMSQFSQKTLTSTDRAIIKKNIGKDFMLGKNDLISIQNYTHVLSDLSKIDTKSKDGWFKKSFDILHISSIQKPKYEEYKKYPEKFDNLARLQNLSNDIPSNQLVNKLKKMSIKSITSITESQWKLIEGDAQNNRISTGRLLEKSISLGIPQAKMEALLQKIEPNSPEFVDIWQSVANLEAVQFNYNRRDQGEDFLRHMASLPKLLDVTVLKEKVNDLKAIEQGIHVRAIGSLLGIPEVRMETLLHKTQPNSSEFMLIEQNLALLGTVQSHYNKRGQGEEFREHMARLSGSLDIATLTDKVNELMAIEQVIHVRASSSLLGIPQAKMEALLQKTEPNSREFRLIQQSIAVLQTVQFNYKRRNQGDDFLRHMASLPELLDVGSLRDKVHALVTIEQGLQRQQKGPGGEVS